MKKAGGLGVSFCIGAGIGFGGGGADDGFGACLVVGGGMGGFECVGSGH